MRKAYGLRYLGAIKYSFATTVLLGIQKIESNSKCVYFIFLLLIFFLSTQSFLINIIPFSFVAGITVIDRSGFFSIISFASAVLKIILSMVFV